MQVLPGAAGPPATTPSGDCLAVAAAWGVSEPVEAMASMTVLRRSTACSGWV